eukprot:m.106663 g.106663  ORF g.106663 m.106663 type:complete len:1328 (+) comp37264_c0_seq9:70-4053(+)
MAEEFTREQKLVFCLARNAIRFRRDLNVRQISSTLVECGVPFPLVDRNRHEENLTLLLRELFRLWSFSNTQRSQQFRIFQLAATDANNSKVLNECFPDLGCSNEELDAVFLSHKDALSTESGSNDEQLLTWLLCGNAAERAKQTVFSTIVEQKSSSSFETLECKAMVQSILAHHKSNGDRSALQALLASAADLATENLHLLVEKTTSFSVKGKRKEAVQEREEAQSIFDMEMHHRKSRSSSDMAKQTLTVATLDTGTKKRGPIETSKCEDLLQGILSCHKHDVLKATHLLAAARKLMETERAAQISHQAKQNSSVEATRQESDSYERTLLNFAYNNVNVYWKQMGIYLGFSRVELNSMDENHQNRHLGVNDMAWSMLHKYFEWQGPDKASIEFLQAVLKKVKDEANPCPRMPADLPFSVKITGRKKELERIENFFWECRDKNYRVIAITERKIQIITGPGGVGKTSLAISYARKHTETYCDGVFYFNAESFASLLVSFRQNILSCESKIDSKDSRSLYENAGVLYSHLRRSPRALVIFDNADDVELIKRCLPGESIPCHVLITIRKKNGHDLYGQENIKTLILETLEEHSAILALLAFAGISPDSFPQMDREEQKFAKKLAVDPPVESLPLALAHAGLFIRKHKIMFKTYWDELQRKKKELHATALDMTKFLTYFHITHLEEPLLKAKIYEPAHFLSDRLTEVNVNPLDKKLLEKAAKSLQVTPHVYLTWEMDLDDLERSHPKSSFVLKCCSVLCTQDIPQWILRNSAFSEEEDGRRDLPIAMAIRPLEERSLLMQASGDNNLSATYAMHHLIQGSVLDRLWKDIHLYQDILQRVGECLSEAFLLSHKNSSMDLSLLPHVYSVAEKMLELGMNSRHSSDIINVACLASALYMQFETEKKLYTLRAENLKHVSEDLEEYGAEQQRRQCHLNLARTHLHLKEHSEANQHFDLAFSWLSIDEISDTEIFRYWHDIHMVVVNYYRQGKLNEAEKLAQRITQFLLSSQPSVINLFAAYVDVSNLYASIENEEKRLQCLTSALKYGGCNNVDDSLVAVWNQNFSGALRSMNKPSEAIAYSSEAVRIFKRILPKNDYRLACAYRELADCLVQVGECSEACKATKIAYEITSSVLPHESNLAADALIFHCNTLVSAGKEEEAALYIERVSSLLENNPMLCEKSKMPEAASKYFFLQGLYFYENGRVQEGTALFEKSLKFEEMLYLDGKGNPEKVYNLTCALGLHFLEANRTEHALRHLARCLEALKEVPLAFPQVATVVSKYINCLISLKQISEAEMKIWKIVEIYSSRSPNDETFQFTVNKLYDNLTKQREDCL